MGDTLVKICGVRSVQDAVMCVDAAADAIGLNFWPSSPRYCEPAQARRIIEHIGDRCQLVGVFVNAPLEEILDLREQLGLRWAQLHGDEPVATLQALLPHAYKALPVIDEHIAEQAQAYPGEHILLDAHCPVQVGGTGRTFNWELAKEIAQRRRVTLAGGLHPGNVAEAIETVRPYRVDVASGVESAPGIKDPAKVRAFMQAVRGAPSGR